MANVADVLASLRKASLDEAKAEAISIVAHEGTVLGSLVPIGTWIEGDLEKVASVAQWRNAARRMFPTQALATTDTTLAFLRRNSIQNTIGILFGIVTAADQFTGHIGVNEVGPTGFELAHLIKGSREGDPKLVFHAEIALIDWCFQQFGGARVTVEVMSYNWIVAMMHKEIGFEVAETLPLVKIESADGVSHRKVDDRGESNVPYTIVRLTLLKGRFYERLAEIRAAG